jgi:hypothetical protein
MTDDMPLPFYLPAVRRKAARIANAFVNAYIIDQLDTKSINSIPNFRRPSGPLVGCKSESRNFDTRPHEGRRSFSRQRVSD